MWKISRWQLVAAVALSAALSVCEGLNLAMVFPLILLLGGEGAKAGVVGPGSGRAFRVLAGTHLPLHLWLPAMLIALMVSTGLLAQLNGVVQTLSVALLLRVRLRLATRLFFAILNAEWEYLARRRAADLTHSLTTELARAGTIGAAMVSLLSNATVAVLMVGVAAYLAPLLTLLILLGLALLVPLQRRAGRRIFQAGEELSVRMRSVFQSSVERLDSLKSIKAFGSEEFEHALFVRHYGSVVEQGLRQEWQEVMASRQFQWLSLALLSGLILLGLGPLHRSPATMLLFLYAFLRAMPRLQTIQGQMSSLMAELPAYERIQSFLVECEAHRETALAVQASESELRGDIEFRGVSFTYAEPGGGTGRTVLDRLTLRLPAGRMTAIAGASGAGKSTLGDLLLGLLRPESGSILIGGTELTRNNAKAWRQQVGYVSQDTHLFHGTLRDNLLWARPEASEAELEEALEAASAGFVHGLKLGLETVVGDRGILFSHGQRQRIALAKALLKRPSLLILDEATNSLDLENEAAILRAILRQGDRLTTVLISHRPSALALADTVLTLVEGRLDEDASGLSRDAVPPGR